MIKAFLLSLIRFYKRSEIIRNEMARNLHLPVDACRFKPTCSEYMYESVEKYGAGKGFWLGFKRFLRCGPWTKGGYDPVK